MVVLVICKNGEDSFENEGTRVVTKFLPLQVYGDFSDAQGQLTLQPGSDLAEFQTHPRFCNCLYDLQE